MNLNLAQNSYMLLCLLILNLIVWTCLGIFLRSVFVERTMLRKLAYQDPVTGLFNRNALNHFWQQHKGKESTAILYIDLDGFKAINDAYGHKVGDMLLHEVSLHLLQVMNANQKAFRIGGDEFLLIIKNFDSDQVKILAQLLLRKISSAYSIHGHRLSVTGSIGISLNPSQKDNLQTLLKEADIAMYHAKRMGRNRYAVYSKISRKQSSSYNTTRIKNLAKDIRKRHNVHVKKQPAPL
ncbi:diguanylate cyclase [Paenibacillus sp. RC254]